MSESSRSTYDEVRPGLQVKVNNKTNGIEDRTRGASHQRNASVEGKEGMGPVSASLISGYVLYVLPTAQKAVLLNCSWIHGSNHYCIHNQLLIPFLFYLEKRQGSERTQTSIRWAS